MYVATTELQLLAPELSFSSLLEHLTVFSTDLSHEDDVVFPPSLQTTYLNVSLKSQVADTALCTPVAWPKSNSLLYCLTLLFITMSNAARPYQPSRHSHCYHLLVIPLAICGVTVHCSDATPSNKRKDPK